ncbi:transglutaminaseTgpA domain-containing protein [Legionella sp. D16C41]|uniref:transglutaminase family protein n=1 Tax=Legionella sp. D16C41 TaxID=3402688 RepID=UPI003AF8A3AF
MNESSKHCYFLILSRYTLITTLFCYLPHFRQSPYWVTLIVIGAIVYKFIAGYFYYPPLPWWLKLILVIGSLILLKIQYPTVITSGFFIGFLATFVALKCLEIASIRDIKFLIFCNFYLIFTALIIEQTLWIIIYLIIAVLINLILMLKLHARELPLSDISRKSLKYLLAVIPFSLLLFYIFPRISEPLWQVPSLTINQAGFSEKMSPGSIAELFNDDRTALRVIFNNQPILNGYWRGLVLNHYNGESWSAVRIRQNNLKPLPELKQNNQADYEVLLEPHQKKWLFYLSYPIAAYPKLLFAENSGLTTFNQKPIHERFSYSLQVQELPYQPLNEMELNENLQLPPGVNPLLLAWSKEHFAQFKDNPRQIVQILKNYINQQPYYYTLTPGQLNLPNQMDEFWFKIKRGYCEHYASAVTIIFRASGIPARVIIGYQGGVWNSVGHYLDIEQNNAHAWVEYWQANQGWQRLDPTSFIAPERVDDVIRNFQSSYQTQTDNIHGLGLTWLQKTKFFFEALRFSAERWLLFYNQDTQQALLQKLGLLKWDTSDLLRVTIILFIIFILLTGLIYAFYQRQPIDNVAKAYKKLQKEFKRFNVPINSSSTLQQQCNILMKKLPKLASEISLFLVNYEGIRLKQAESYAQNKQKQILKLFKKFKKLLHKTTYSN